jgi:predicted transcriptional regulator
MTKKIAKKVIVTKKLVGDKDKPATLKHLENLRKDLKSEMVDLRKDMVELEVRIKKYVKEEGDKNHRDAMVVFEDVNERIKAIAEIALDNRRILDKLDRVTDTVYNNHAPRIAVLETVLVK